MENATILSIMTQAKYLISKGFSVVPLMMDTNNKKNDKRPIGYWTKFQNEIITPQEFFEKINKHNGDVGIGIICGAVSGNLESLDIDDKHYHGVALRFLKELNDTYPEIYKKLRIEKTINHGVHLPYRISDGLAYRSKDISKRYATEDELKARPDLKTYTFIELKGEGGKFTTPPTKGYSFIQENDIPSLTRHEADLIINLATLFNEVTPEIKKPYTKIKSFRNYSSNPWDDYNSSDAAVSLLDKHGWKMQKDNRNYTHYSRPESKSGSVSASFIKNERYYFVFTTQSSLESQKGYSPSSLLCELEFNGDTKECYKYLIDNGFGVFTDSFEQKLINNAIVNRASLPVNLSEKSRKQYEVLKDDFEKQYPYGIFWEGDGEDGFKINKELILKVASDFGYKIHNANLVKVYFNEIISPSYRDFYEDLKAYIKIDKESDRLMILDKFEDYIQKSGKYLVSRLPILDASKILNDTRGIAYKPFLNGILKITKTDVSLINYEDNDKYYFSNNVIDDSFDFDKKEGGLFVDFLDKAILKNEHLRKYIGYYLHKYKDSSTAYYMVLTETVDDPKLGGGSGKNVFTNLLGHFTTSLEVPGSQIKFTSEFFQSWKDQKLMVVSDLPKSFDFHFFKNLSSNSALIKKLYKDEYEVKPEELPKLIFSTNYSFDITDGGLKRRTIILEFTDFFTKQGGVDAHYGGVLFPNDWNSDDWQGYYHYMVNCIKEYLKAPKLVSLDVSEGGWTKNFNLTHGKSTHEFIIENINTWLSLKNVEVSKFNDSYNNFCNENGIQLRYQKSSTNMNVALEAYCEHFGIDYIKSMLIRQPNTNNPIRCKVFKGNEIDNGFEVSNNDDDFLPF